jgi:hypothetical protein
MDKSAIRSAFPYVVGLVVAALLYHYAQQIEYTPRPGMLGPDFWPKIAIGLIAVMCVFEIVRIFTGSKSEAHGVADAFEKEEAEAREAPPQKYPWLLAAGIVLVVVYAFVVDTLGFLLSTFLFQSIFMYLGRYRNHAVIWATSTVITLVAALIFMRFAYVSLPRGAPPFDAVTDFIRVMVGG